MSYPWAVGDVLHAVDLNAAIAQAAAGAGPGLPTAGLSGYLFGLTLANDATTPNTVLDVAAGACASSTGTVMITLGAFTKTINGAWVAGSGQNGMGGGLTATALTWYHVFACVNAGASDVFFDTSPTAANAPLGTTSFRRIGAIKLDSLVHIIPFSQRGDEFLWRTSTSDVSAIPQTTAILAPLSVPLGIQVNALYRATYSDGVNNSVLLITSPDESDQGATLAFGGNSLQVPQAAGGAYGASAHFNTRTNTSAQIRYRSNGTSSNLFSVHTYGWIDTRGRNA